MIHYELLYIVPSILPDEEVQKIKGHIAQILEKNSATVSHHTVWERRKLAYSIGQVEHGIYILCYFDVESGKNVEEIKRHLRLNQSILRSTVVKHTTNLDAHIKRFIEKQEPKRMQERIVKAPQAPQMPVSVREQQLPVQEHSVEKEPLLELGESEKDSAQKQAETEEIAPAPQETPAAQAPKASKTKKKPSLKELDQKLEDIIGGDIEL